MTLRADFLAAALSSPALSGALRRSVYTLGAMTAGQLRAVVAEPLADIPGVGFQDGLVERILTDVGTDPGALPLLGLALTLLWERQSGGQLTHQAYENLGRVPGSLGRYAEDVWSRGGLADDEETARQLFLRRVQVSSGGEITRRVATSDDLGAVRWALAQRLATTRLLVTGRDAENRETVELAHEALVDGWVRLRDWIDADRDFLAWRE
ncbi:MAG: caspase, EACC1-associated type, partial [Pseudonocardiaceae bacterium]